MAHSRYLIYAGCLTACAIVTNLQNVLRVCLYVPIYLNFKKFKEKRIV